MVIILTKEIEETVTVSAHLHNVHNENQVYNIFLHLCSVQLHNNNIQFL